MLSCNIAVSSFCNMSVILQHYTTNATLRQCCSRVLRQCCRAVLQDRLVLQAYARWGENGPASAFFTHVPRHTAVHTRDHTTPCGCLRLAHQCELRTHGPLSCCCAAWTTPQLPLP
eukprot:scaffold59077_cov90-Phaeocystis_antarctica.AAC.1